ncbi:MAG: hypothetical protein QOI47_841 [Actinomycetota bacterium]|nr:hypothetical protein [Actinomycetota bacterium]
MVVTHHVIWFRRFPACVAAAVFGFLVGTAGVSTVAASPAATLASTSRVAVAHVDAAPITTTTTAAPAPAVVAPVETTTTTIAARPTAVVQARTQAPTATTAPVKLAAVAAPAPAPAPAPAAVKPAPTPAPAPPTPAQVGAAALTKFSYPWQRLGYSLSFEGANPGLLGKTDCGTKQVTVYVRPTQTVQQVAFVTAFELAHGVDCGRMTDARRAEWASIRGFAAGWTWFPGCLCTEDSFGSGDFSMVFANWLVPNGGYRWRSNLAAPPSATMLQQLVPYLQP